MRSHKCPACDGMGTRSRPPYVAGDQTAWSSNSSGPWSCRSCGGGGVLWTRDPPVTEETTMILDPMTDDDLVAIGVGGFSALTPVPALLAEVHRLREGIRSKAEAWDREEPAALAFRVTADFRTLIGDDDE